ncbi:MAG: DUF6034 family protein [Clostridia bacterium]
MKRIISFFLVVGLLLSASLAHAETVWERVFAPEILQLDATSPQNVSIHMDASVVLPNINTFPTQEVGRRIVSQQEVTAMADAAFGSGNYRAIDDGNQPLSPQPDSVTAYQQNAFGAMIARVGNESASLTAIYGEKNGILSTVQVQYSANQWENENYTPGNLPPLSTVPDSIGTLSLEAARDKAIAIALAVNGELTHAATEAYPTVHYTDMESMEYQYEIVGAVYVFRFTHRIGDAHVTYEDSATGGALDSQNDTYTLPFYYERFWVALNESGVMGMEYVSPYEVIGTLTEDVTLLPFDSVLSIANATLPLKYASAAQYGDMSLDIDRIVLGYTRVTIKNAPDRYQLIPAWDFMGYVTFPDGHKQGDGNTSLLCVNAMDGTIIDRAYGY